MTEQIPKNPFGVPLRDFLAAIRSTKWEFPYIPQCVQLVVSVFLMVLCAALYFTVGIDYQIYKSLWNLADGCRSRLSSGPPHERSGSAIAMACFVLAAFPFLVIQSPFQLVAKIFEKYNIMGIIIFHTLVGVLVAVIVFWTQIGDIVRDKWPTEINP